LPRTRYTLGDLKERLHERVGNNYTFWKSSEATDALNEAISFWQALTGEWTTRATIEARSDSPSFYPVPKQIVSLTRVGTGPSSDMLNPLGGHILPNHPVYLTAITDQETSEIYFGPTGVPISWQFKPTGGVAPYRLVWDWGDGSPPEAGDLSLYHTFPTTIPDGTTIQICVTVNDAAGDVFTTCFDLLILNQTLYLWWVAQAIPGPPPPPP
jgi:hypothetical protein